MGEAARPRSGPRRRAGRRPALGLRLEAVSELDGERAQQVVQGEPARRGFGDQMRAGKLGHQRAHPGDRLALKNAAIFDDAIEFIRSLMAELQNQKD